MDEDNFVAEQWVFPVWSRDQIGRAWRQQEYATRLGEMTVFVPFNFNHATPVFLAHFHIKFVATSSTL